MQDFAREPTRFERILAVTFSAVLAGLFGALTIFTAYYGLLLVSLLFCVLLVGAITLLYRAAFTGPRALRGNESRFVAWSFLVIGIAVVAVAFFLQGSAAHRLLALGPGLTILVAGIVGIGKRGSDA